MTIQPDDGLRSGEPPAATFLNRDRHSMRVFAMFLLGFFAIAFSLGGFGYLLRIINNRPVPRTFVVQAGRQNLAGGSPLFGQPREGMLPPQPFQQRQQRQDPGSQLIWFDRSGKELSVLGEADSYLDLVLSPNGKWASVSIRIPDARTDYERDIWLYSTGDGQKTRLTSGPAFARTSIWSPDGSKIVFASARRGHYDLYEKSVKSAAPEQMLVSDDVSKFPDSWSPDGRYILYLSDDHDLFLLPMFGDKKPVPFLPNSYVESEAQFSPDGRWVAYLSDESGEGEIYVTSFPNPDHKWRISVGGGNQPRWSRDGSEIFYLTHDNWLMSVPVNGKGAAFQASDAKPLFQTRFAGPPWEYDVSADGKSFLINTERENLPPGAVIASLIEGR